MFPVFLTNHWEPIPSCIVAKKTGKTGKTGKCMHFVHVVLLLRDLGKIEKLEKPIISRASYNLRKLLVIQSVVHTSYKILGICSVCLKYVPATWVLIVILINRK